MIMNFSMSTMIFLAFLSMAAGGRQHSNSDHHQANLAQEVNEWFNQLPNMQKRYSHLHFYFHDIVTGKNPTAVRVAAAPTTNFSATSFGYVAMADDPLTEGQDKSSKLLGHAQGIYGSADQKETALLMGMNIVFLDDGPYNGSTLSLLARNPSLHKFREMAIVGGTGCFRMANGVAVAETILFNATNGDTKVRYDVYVAHY